MFPFGSPLVLFPQGVSHRLIVSSPPTADNPNAALQFHGDDSAKPQGGRAYLTTTALMSRHPWFGGPSWGLSLQSNDLCGRFCLLCEKKKNFVRNLAAFLPRHQPSASTVSQLENETTPAPP